MSEATSPPPDWLRVLDPVAVEEWGRARSALEFFGVEFDDSALARWCMAWADYQFALGLATADDPPHIVGRGDEKGVLINPAFDILHKRLTSLRDRGAELLGHVPPGDYETCRSVNR